MTEPNDPAGAAARLETALERIAVSAAKARDGSNQAANPPVAEPTEPVELARRLDALIGRLRTALASPDAMQALIPEGDRLGSGER